MEQQDERPEAERPAAPQQREPKPPQVQEAGEGQQTQGPAQRDRGPQQRSFRDSAPEQLQVEEAEGDDGAADQDREGARERSRAHCERGDVSAMRPGQSSEVRSIQGERCRVATSGDLMQWHPHGHLLVTDGGFSDAGAFQPIDVWDTEALMKLFRERLLACLIERHAISEELARKLLAWRHPGFSAHIGSVIPFEDRKAIEDVARCLVRAPLSLKKLVYLDGQKAVLYRSKMNPFLGRNFEAMDPLEWRARLTDHIPDAGKHRTQFCAYYANRVRGGRSPEVVDGPADEDETPTQMTEAPHLSDTVT